MINQEDTQKIKSVAEELLQKMTIEDFIIEVNFSLNGEKDVVDLNIELKEPQFLIGQGGQTLFELERVLRIILSKELKKNFYLKLDINNYKKKKIEYLKNLAREFADEVSLSQKSKILPPMFSYERRIIHVELSQRQDITTESQGDGEERKVVINPR